MTWTYFQSRLALAAITSKRHQSHSAMGERSAPVAKIGESSAKRDTLLEWRVMKHVKRIWSAFRKSAGMRQRENCGK